MLHNQIFEMLYHTQGGFGWHELYNMPVWLRRFYYTKLAKQLQNEHDQAQKASKGGTSPGAIPRGPFGPK
jgi:hypothetical protein